MENKKNIHPIWQQRGQSTHILAKMLAEKLQTKTSHTGTLDPMAEGVIILLADDTRLKKYEYAKWLKTYRFDIVLGIETDSLDALGLITKIDSAKAGHKNITSVVNSFKGKYKQTVPFYSAIKVKGKPLHWYARNNKVPQPKNLPIRTGEIKKIKVNKICETKKSALCERIIDQIATVKGDLRQTKITRQWKDVKSNKPKTNKVLTSNLMVISITTQTTKGLYIRQLSQDICKKMGTIGFTANLVREKNGIYSKKDCVTIEY